MLIVSTNRGGNDFLTYYPNVPALLVQSNCKMFVGSIFYILASMTAGLERKIMRIPPEMIKKNLIK